MTGPDHPLPSGGGIYMRDPETGALTEVTTVPDAATDAPPQPATGAAPEALPAKGRKSTAKEG